MLLVFDGKIAKTLQEKLCSNFWMGGSSREARALLGSSSKTLWRHTDPRAGRSMLISLRVVAAVDPNDFLHFPCVVVLYWIFEQVFVKVDAVNSIINCD